MRILLIDDDEALMKSLAERLIRQRYAVDIAVDGSSAQTYVELFDYDLIVLDLVLPDGDGIHFCHQFRRSGYSNPLMILTAKESTLEKVKALDAGADDYVIKPFNFDELCARIRALLRRESHGLPTIFNWGALSLDPSTCETTYAQQPIRLTPKEFSLMELFLRHPHRVYSLSSIMDDLWPYEDPPGEDTIRTHIKGLRRKLKAAGAPKDLIKTVYGQGYKLNENTVGSQLTAASGPNQQPDEPRRVNQQPAGKDGGADKHMASSPTGASRRDAQTDDQRSSQGANQGASQGDNLTENQAAPALEESLAWSKSWSAVSRPVGDRSAQIPVWQAYSLRRQSPIGEQPLPSKIAIACKHYLRTASQQIAVLEEATLALVNGKLTAKLHHSSQLNAHKLAGSLGSFGMSEGSQLARTLETQLRARALFAADAFSTQDTDTASTDRDTTTSETAIPLLPPLALMSLVEQLRRSIEQATVQTISQALSAVVQESTPLLLIVSLDSVLATQFSQAAAAHQLRTHVVTSPDQAERYLNTTTVIPELILLDYPAHAATESSNRVDSMAYDSACDVLIQTIRQDYDLPIVALTHSLTLERRLSLVNQGVEMVSDRTLLPSDIIHNATHILKNRMGHVRVAIADDDPQMLALLKVSLEPWGFSVNTFISALDMWQWLTAPQPFSSTPALEAPATDGVASARQLSTVVSKADILVLDVEMPKMNGLELCRVLRADARFQNLPILFLTIHQEKTLRQQAFQSGADDFIDKTVAPVELATRLRNQLARACRI